MTQRENEKYIRKYRQQIWNNEDRRVAELVQDPDRRKYHLLDKTASVAEQPGCISTEGCRYV